MPICLTPVIGGAAAPRIARNASRRISSQPGAARWLAAAVLGGAVIAIAPLPWTLALLVGGALVFALLAEPLVGLGLALLLGPLKALVGVAMPELAAADPGQVFLGLALASWVLRGLAGRSLRVPRVALLWPLLAYATVGAISLWSAPDHLNGLRELVKWAEIAVVAAFVVDAVARGRLGWVLALALLAGVVQAGVGIWQFGLRGVGPDHFEIQPGFYRAYGAFEQPNPFGGFMGMVWPVAAGLAIGIWQSAGGRRRSRISHPRAAIRKQPSAISNRRSRIISLALAFVALLTGLALVLSFSRGAWLGAAAAAGTMVVFWPRRRLLGLTLGVAALGLVVGLLRAGALPASVAARFDAIGEVTQVFSARDVRGEQIEEANFSLLERIAHWQAAVAMADANPWLGVGLGNWDAAYPDFSLINWRAPLGHAHNIYLNVLAETGLVGLLAYAAMWIAIVWVTLRALRDSRGWRRGLAVGLLGVWVHLAVHQLVDNLYVNNLHLYFGTLLGVLAAMDSSPALDDPDTVR